MCILATDHAIGVDLSKPFGVHIPPQLALGVAMGLQNLVFALLGFGMTLIPSLSQYYFYFGIRIFTLNYFMLEVFIF